MNHEKTLGAELGIVETEALRIEATSSANRRQ